MKHNQQELKPVTGPQETAIEKEPNKFWKVIEKIGKRNIIIACSVLLIGAAVLINWVLFSNANKKTQGYQNYNQQTQNEQSTPTSTNTTQSYFSATQVSRQRARDEALEVLQSVVDNNDASETVKSEALAEIAVIADEIRKEADIETLITAKGFEECVAVLNGDSISIVVKSEESLIPAQIAQINEIVYQETGITPTGVTIIQKA